MRPRLALCLALCLSPLALEAEPLSFGLRLPAGSKAAWVMHQEKPLPEGSRFDIDKEGHAWVLMGPRILFASDGSTVVMEKPLRDIAFGGSYLAAATDLAVGRLELRLMKKRVLVAKVHPQLLLPEPSWRLASNTASPAVIGFDGERGRGLLFRVDDQHKILEWPERILAAVGTEGAWFLSTPSGIERVAPNGAHQYWGVLPGGASSLAWVKDAGLAVAGPQGVAFFRAPNKIMGLSDAKGARVRARGNKLYVLLPEQGGVMQVTGLGAQ